MSRPRMKTIDPSKWKPVVLTAPDGREYTPSSHSEHRQLLASGYAVKKTDPAPAAPIPAVPESPAAPAVPESPAAPAVDKSTPKSTTKAGEK